jgi:hypothetical protein
MNFLFAHADHADPSFIDSTETFLQHPVVAFIAVTLMAFLFLMATLYVLDHYTSLAITNSKKRG